MGTALQRRPDPWATRFTDWLELPDLFRYFDRDRFDEMIKVEETFDADKLVIKAEMPGIDPDTDVDIQLADGMLTIAAERRDEGTTEEGGRKVSEFRYGSFHRALRVPKGVKPDDVTAEYRDGILTITVPIPTEPAPEAAKVAVTRS